MAAQKGSEMLLKMDTASTGGPTFTTIAGLQTKQLQLDSESVDITNQDSANKWRELLEGAGIRKARCSGSGVFKDSVAENAVLTAKLAGSIKQWQVIVPGLGTFQGLWQITSLELQGPHDKEVAYSISLESAGEITFTTAA